LLFLGSMNHRLGLGLLAVAALALGGCSEAAVHDDVDLDLDFSALVGPSNDLHTPYVLGAHMDLYVVLRDENASHDGYSIESDDASILDVSATLHQGNQALVHAVATGAGRTKVHVRNPKGVVVSDSDVLVEVPDHAELYASGDEFLGKAHEEDGHVHEVRMLAGGTATYQVRYFAGSQELHGNGALGVQVDGPAQATVLSSFLFEDRDWVQITNDGGIGMGELSLSAGGQPMAAVPLTVLSQSDITEVRVVGQDEGRAHDGDWMVLLGESFDGSARRVYGVDYAWDEDGTLLKQDAPDGTQVIARGDLYRYEYLKGDYHTLTVHLGDMTASAMIQSDTGVVSSSNVITCSAAPWKTGSSGLALVMAGLGLVAVRRRKLRAS
jgi:hypothetical protein